MPTGSRCRACAGQAGQEDIGAPFAGKQKYLAWRYLKL